MHYNSWFDFASWQEPNASLYYRNMTEKICLDRVERFGTRAVQYHPHGGQSAFVWLSARAMHPHGACVW